MAIAAAPATPAWLEIVRGNAPLLLFAPHGGRAGAAARAVTHPKVNDLETAAITRELAQRMEATALVNSGMDRNELDCNRLSQVAQREPWLLDTIAHEVSRITARHGRITILLIHGWNIIEPRVDLGLGLKERTGRLYPTRGAYVSADDQFIEQTAHALAARLRGFGIVPTFGLRYPGGDAQNLLQMFTPRHATSENRAVRQLAALAASGAINAMQLELSVAVRLAGAPRQHLIEAVVTTFGLPRQYRPPVTGDPPRVARDQVAKSSRKTPSGSSNLPPFRIGVEFYDPTLGLGGMASFDFGPNAAGGRIMMLFERRRVALFTGEGGALRIGDSVALGPLTLDGGDGSRGLRFRGPAVVVDDGTAYLSVEGALASGRLDPRMEVDTVLEFVDGVPHFGDVLDRLEAHIALLGERSAAGATVAPPSMPHPSFGRMRGMVSFEGERRRLDALARVGVSFTGLGVRKFAQRRMLWACANGTQLCDALELSALEFDQAPTYRSAGVLCRGVWQQAELTAFALESGSPLIPPDSIAASIRHTAGLIALEGTPDTFMTLSRPGPDSSRIHTSLGFARFRINGQDAAGMYEYSRRAPTTAPADVDPED
jgi:hypothetical protein